MRWGDGRWGSSCREAGCSSPARRRGSAPGWPRRSRAPAPPSACAPAGPTASARWRNGAVPHGAETYQWITDLSGSGAGRRARARRPRRDGRRRHPREQRGHPEASPRHRHRRRRSSTRHRRSTTCRRSGSRSRCSRRCSSVAPAASSTCRRSRPRCRHPARPRTRVEVGARGVLRVHERRPLGHRRAGAGRLPGHRRHRAVLDPRQRSARRAGRADHRRRRGGR